MGLLIWILAGLAALAAARAIPLRKGALRREAITAVAAAVAGGVIATSLDFGGWNEAEPAAGIFAFLVGFAATGVLRSVSVLRR